MHNNRAKITIIDRKVAHEEKSSFNKLSPVLKKHSQQLPFPHLTLPFLTHHAPVDNHNPLDIHRGGRVRACACAHFFRLCARERLTYGGKSGARWRSSVFPVEKIFSLTFFLSPPRNRARSTAPQIHLYFPTLHTHTLSPTPRRCHTHPLT